MSNIAKALAKHENREDTGKTEQPIIENLVSGGANQKGKERTVPKSKRLVLPLVFLFLVGTVLGFSLKSQNGQGIMLPPPSDLADVQPAWPVTEKTERVEAISILPSMTGPEPASQSNKDGKEDNFAVRDEKGSESMVPQPASVSNILPLEEETNVFLQNWKEAWQQSAGPGGDLGGYVSFYAESFSPGRLDKAAWLRDKAKKNSGKAWIKVELEHVSIREQPNGRIHVRFEQQYQSSNYSEKSSKTLLLVREAGKLKILSESD